MLAGEQAGAAGRSPPFAGWEEDVYVSRVSWLYPIPGVKHSSPQPGREPCEPSSWAGGCARATQHPGRCSCARAASLHTGFPASPSASLQTARGESMGTMRALSVPCSTGLDSPMAIQAHAGRGAASVAPSTSSTSPARHVTATTCKTNTETHWEHGSCCANGKQGENLWPAQATMGCPNYSTPVKLAPGHHFPRRDVVWCPAVP